MDGSQQLGAQLSVARNFIEALTGSPDTIIRVRFIFERGYLDNREAYKLAKSDHPPRDAEGPIEALWSDIVEHQERGYAVYYFMNPVKLGNGSGRDGAATDADVTAIRTLGIDADAGLPTAWHVEPSIIVATSTRDGVKRGQALWLVRDLPVSDFKPAQERLAVRYASDTSVTNPSRIFRLPGTLHLKDSTSPQPVTFEWLDPLGEPKPSVDILAGLPPTPERKPASSASGAPVTEEQLRARLAWLDPGASRDVWRNHVAAIHATPLEVDADASKRREIAQEWCEGKIDRLGRYALKPPANYMGADDVSTVFDDMPPRESGGVNFGTLDNDARAAGFDGPSARPQQSAADAFGPAVEALKASEERTEEKAERSKRSRFYPVGEEEMDLADTAKWLVPEVIPDCGTVLMVG